MTSDDHAPDISLQAEDVGVSASYRYRGLYVTIDIADDELNGFDLLRFAGGCRSLVQAVYGE